MPKKIKINKRKEQVKPQEQLVQTTVDTPTLKEDLYIPEISSTELTEEASSQTGSDDIDFEEEVRKLIGLRNATQSPQYISQKRTETKQVNTVIDFVKPLNNTTSYVASSSATCKGSMPVGRRDPSAPSSRQ